MHLPLVLGSRPKGKLELTALPKASLPTQRASEREEGRISFPPARHPKVVLS